MTDTSRLSLRGVAFARRERRVLDAIDLTLAPGELVALVGRNGAGKTTLMRIAAGILSPDSGDVRLGEVSMRARSRRDVAKEVAYLPQAEVGADVELSVEEVVRLGRAPHGSPFSPLSSTDLRAIDRALGDANVSSLRDRLLSELSAGERQRALLARAFAHESRVLLLDEPTASLDAAGSLELVRAVRTRVEEGAAALVAMHDLFLVARTADRVIVLDGAKIAGDGPPAEVLTTEMLDRAFGLKASLAREGGELVLRTRDG